MANPASSEVQELTFKEARSLWLGKNVMIAAIPSFSQNKDRIITEAMRDAVWRVEDVWVLYWGEAMMDMHLTERVLMTLVNERLDIRMHCVLGSEVVRLPN